MFSTDYNRKIAEQVNKINEDFVKHSKKVNRIGGGLLNVAQVDKTALARPIGGKKASKSMEGEGFFGDIWDGVKSVFGGAIPDELLDEPSSMVEGGKKKRGKKGKGSCCSDCMEGSGIYETDDLMEGGVQFPRVVKGGKKGKKGGNILDDLVDDIGKVAPLIALGKPKKGKGISGGVKKTSPWIEHVKAYAKKYKMKYPDALKDAKCRASYKK
jgi:hypothetical protein